MGLFDGLKKGVKFNLNLGSRVYDQLNPLDEGRSFTTRVPDSKRPENSHDFVVRQIAKAGQDRRAGRISENQYQQQSKSLSNRGSQILQKSNRNITNAYMNLPTKVFLGKNLRGEKVKGAMYAPTRQVIKPVTQVALNLSRGNPITGLQSFGNYISKITDDIPVVEQLGDYGSRIARLPAQATNVVTRNPLNQKVGQIEGSGADMSDIDNKFVRFAAGTAGTIGQTSQFALHAPTATVGVFGEVGNENYDELIAQGKSKNEAKLKSITSSAIQAGIEKWSSKVELGLAAMFGKKGVKKVVDKSLKKKIVEYLVTTQKTGGIEAAEEVLQTITNNIATGKQWNKGIVEAGKQGYIGGATLGVLGTGVDVYNKANTPTGLTAEQQEQRNVLVERYSKAKDLNKPDAMQQAAREIDAIDLLGDKPIVRLKKKVVKPVQAYGPRDFGNDFSNLTDAELYKKITDVRRTIGTDKFDKKLSNKLAEELESRNNQADNQNRLTRFNLNETVRAGRTKAKLKKLDSQLSKAPVESKGVFKNTTGENAFDGAMDDGILKGNQTRRQYFNEEKGYKVEVETMTPGEYLARSVKDGDITKAPIDQAKVDKYAKAMKNGEKFDMVYLDKIEGGQEGRHRALAAKQLGVKEIPVAVKSKFKAPVESKPKVTTKVDNEKVTSQEMSDRVQAMQEAGLTQKEIADEVSSLEVIGKSTDLRNTVVAKDGNTIDVETGEIIPIKGLEEGKFVPTYKNVDPSKLDRNQVEIVRKSLKNSADKSVDSLVAVVEQKSGDSFENFAKAVQENSRNDTPMPEHMLEAQQAWDAAIEELRNSGIIPSSVGRVKGSWIHQERVGSGDVEVDGTISLATEIDKGIEAYQERTGKVGLDEMDYSDRPTRKFLYQLINDKFKRQDQVNALIDKQAEQGIELTPEQANEAIEKTEELVGEISEAIDTGGIMTSATEKLDMLPKLNEIGREKGIAQIVYDKSLGWTARQVQSSAEIYNRYTVLVDGEVVNLSKLMGFEKYLASGAVGIQQNTESNGDIDVTDYMNKEWSDVAVEQKVKDDIIKGLVGNLSRISTKLDYLTNQYKTALDPDEQKSLKKDIQKYSNPNFIQQQREDAFRSANRKLTREMATTFGETFVIKDKQLAKNINHDLKRMLTQDANSKSIAAKLTRGAATAGYHGALGWNVLSAFQNLTELKRTWMKYTTKEFGVAVKNAFADPDIVRRYDFRRSNYANPDESIKQRQKTKWYTPLGMFDSTEAFKDAVQLHATEARYKKSTDLTGTKLIEAVYHEAQKWALKYGQGGSLGYSKSKTGTLLGQFSQYAAKESKLLYNQLHTGFVDTEATVQQSRDARKYVAKMAGANAVLYTILSALLGSSWEYVFGVLDPIGKTYTDDEAGIDEKTIARIPGGPAVSLLKDLFISVREMHRDADKNEVPTEYGSKLITNNVKKSLAVVTPGGNQFINKTGGFITDQMQGYNESRDGRARFAQAEGNFDKVRGLVFGRYSTNNAREYFGSQGPLTDAPVVGQFFAQDRQSPVSGRIQEKVDEVKGTSWNNKLRGKSVTEKNKAEIKRLIETSREMTNEKKALRADNPEAYNAVQSSTGYKELSDGTYESDVISPDKWDAIGSDKSLKAFEYMREKVKANAIEFGDLVDPIYSLTDKNKITQLLAMRSLPTGDDREMKSRLRTEDWYKKFENELSAYYERLNAKSFDGNDMFKKTDRAQEYYKLSTSNPAFDESLKSEILKQYEAIREKSQTDGEDSQAELDRKAFYKANADALNDEYAKRSQQQLEWTNKMRKIEGVDPLSKEVWENATFGYNDDEEAVARRIAFKYGGYYKSGSSGGGSGRKTKPTIGNYGISITTGSTGKKAKIKFKMPPKSKVGAKAVKISKPRVSLKKSMV